MDKKKTILLLSFIFSPNIGGVESHLDDLCAYLTKQNYKVRVITYQPLILKSNAQSFERHKNIEIRRISWFKNLFSKFEPYPILQMCYLIPGILFYSFFYLLKHRKEIDIIQTHGFNMAIVGFILSRIFKIPFVVNTHVLFYFQKKSLYAKTLSFILNKARYILVLTNDAKKQLEKIGVKNKKIIVYHQWIDTKLFKPLSKELSRKKYQFKTDDFIILFTGRLVRAKGVAILLDAISFFKKNKNIHFVFTGSGELARDVQRSAKNNSQIHFLGKVAKEELPILYSLADVCIFPSIQATKTYAEGIPRVMIEAMTCGTPIIATKTGGVSEVISNDVGFFVKPNVKECMAIIKYVSSHRNFLSKIGERCISYSKEIFGITRNTQIIEGSLK